MATIPSVLAARVSGPAGTTQAYYLGGGTTLAQIGPDVSGAVPAYPGDNSRFQSNMVIKFQGTRFCMDLSTGAQTRVRRYNAYSNTWEVVNITATGNFYAILGLFPYQEAGGVSGIFAAFSGDNTTWVVTRTTDGVIWTTTNVGVSSIGVLTLGRGHMHRNKVVFSLNSTGGVASWHIIDPVGGTISNIIGVSDGPTTSSLGCTSSIVTFNNRLFLLFTRNVATTTAVAVASNGVNVNTFVGAQTLNVTSTTSFPASGTLNVQTGSGYQVVTYTGGGGGGTTFTGCTSAGAGVLGTGGAVDSGDNAQAQLYELVGGVWVSLVGMGINSTIYVGVLPSSAHALLPIGNTKLVAIVKVSNALSIGTRAYDLTPSGGSFTVSEVTTPLIPATLRPGGGAGTAQQRWGGFVDDVTVPGTPAVFAFLWSDDLSTGSISYYEYVNSTTALTPGSLGPAANVAIPACVTGGGSYVAAANDLDVWLTRTTPVLAGTRLSYLASGLFTAASVRNSVAYATTGILPGTVVASGSGVGKSLGTALTGALTVDGVTGFTTALNTGMRVLVKNQAAPADNGIYTLTLATGSSYTLVRATDFDQPAEVYNGASVRVGGGNTLAGTRWMQTTANPITVDTTALAFTQVLTDAGLLFRASCRLATTAALPACTPAGSGVGKTLTANAVGILSVDATNAVLGDRIMVKNQVAPADNGLYSVTTEGTAGVAFVLTRATDFDAVGQNEVMPGAYTYVTGGSSNLDTYFEMTTDGQITMESTALAFTSRMPVSWKMFYNTAENTDMTQGTLFGTATGGPSLRATNQVNRVAADGVEPSTADWRAGTGGDGLQSGQAVTAFQRLNV